MRAKVPGTDRSVRSFIILLPPADRLTASIPGGNFQPDGNFEPVLDR
ncbi:hypothetical protein [Alkalinema sp. FACHB-956]|nr:hypothetical protein [Alkalinema sp. FACHB-956]MBD2326783.1 hypothetical protein [Alkalinema sp. FACHB-956]